MHGSIKTRIEKNGSRWLEEYNNYELRITNYEHKHVILSQPSVYEKNFNNSINHNS